MILFNLRCTADHEFEAWFRNGDSYADQAAKGVIACPVCGDHEVRKAPMAPSLVKGVAKRQDNLAALRDMVATHFDDVGDRFAEEARQIHYGEIDARPIRGQTSLAEAKDLIDEGISVLPLPWGVESDA